MGMGARVFVPSVARQASGLAFENNTHPIAIIPKKPSQWERWALPMKAMTHSTDVRTAMRDPACFARAPREPVSHVRGS